MTRAPWPAAMRAARTPPEPPPMTNRSTSKSAIVSPPGRWSDRPPASYPPRLHILAALVHLGAEHLVDVLGEARGPFLHELRARQDRLRLLHQQLLADRRLVEGDDVLQL